MGMQKCCDISYREPMTSVYLLYLYFELCDSFRCMVLFTVLNGAADKCPWLVS